MRQPTDTIRIGTVIEIALDQASVRVKVGAIETGWIDWGTFRAGELRVWSPPSEGEQVALCLPDGDWQAAFLLTSLFSDANPPPASDGQTLFLFDDGARFSYDPASAQLTIDLSEPGGAIGIRAPGNIAIEADIELTGKLTATDDVIADGISLVNHKHSGVQAGSAQSGKPV